MPAMLEARLRACERTQRRLWVAMTLTLLLAVAVVLSQPTVDASTTAPATATTLRVTELVVVDPQGVERVRIGANLPDAVIDGRRIARGSPVAGVMLYDRSGQERGGYVTFDEGDNIALTLDGLQGQNALFAAGPDGSTVAQLWFGDESIELRADSNGARLAHASDGRSTLQLPEIIALGAQTCTLFRNGLRPEVPEGVDPAQVRDICLQRFSASACTACLDAPSAD